MLNKIGLHIGLKIGSLIYFLIIFIEVTVKMCDYLQTRFQQIFFFRTTATNSFEISNEDRATWPQERSVFLEGAQGLLLKKKMGTNKVNEDE
jgi:hypothetical protein